MFSSAISTYVDAYTIGLIMLMIMIPVCLQCMCTPLLSSSHPNNKLYIRLYCSVLYCIVFYCIVLHGFLLYNTLLCACLAEFCYAIVYCAMKDCMMFDDRGSYFQYGILHCVVAGLSIVVNVILSSVLY